MSGEVQQTKSGLQIANCNIKPISSFNMAVVLTAHIRQLKTIFSVVPCS